MTYYGLVSGLPDPQIGRPMGMDISALKALLFSYMPEQDAQLLDWFFYRIDLYNMLAIAEQNDVFSEGGHLNREETEHWMRSMHTDVFPFSEVATPEGHSKAEQLEYLHQLWQVYYDNLIAQSDENTRRLWSFEIGLHNFTAGYMFKQTEAAGEPRFIDGGHFDRFAYSRLMLGDIQSEHPFTASVLACLEMEHPAERRQAMSEKSRKFYDYASFFEPFGMSGVMAWLLKALEVLQIESYQTEQGANRLKTFSQNIIHTAEQQLI